MKSSLCYFLGAFLFFVFHFHELHSSTILTSTAPSNPYVSNTVGGGGLQWRNDTTNGRRDVGQSFYVSSGITMDSITYQISPTSGPAAITWSNVTYAISLYEIGAANYATPGTLVAASTGNLASMGSGGNSLMGNYLTFDLPDTQLTAGKYYVAVLTMTSAATSTQNIVFNVSTSNSAYADGQAIYTTDGTTYSTWGTDMVFFVNTVAIPEPGTVTLGIMGILFLAGYSLKRKFQAA